MTTDAQRNLSNSLARPVHRLLGAASAASTRWDRTLAPAVLCQCGHAKTRANQLPEIHLIPAYLGGCYRRLWVTFHASMVTFWRPKPHNSRGVFV